MRQERGERLLPTCLSTLTPSPVLLMHPPQPVGRTSSVHTQSVRTHLHRLDRKSSVWELWACALGCLSWKTNNASTIDQYMMCSAGFLFKDGRRRKHPNLGIILYLWECPLYIQ